MSDEAPLLHLLEADGAAVAITTDTVTVVGEAPEAGTVSKVSYIPNAAKSGADTNSRTLALVNKGQDGSGTTVVASLALTAGHDLVAADEKAITLSVVAGATTVAAGDVLAWTSTHVGTGITDPGGKVHVEITR